MAPASLDARLATSPSADPSSSASAAATAPELCVSVQRGQASIKRGQDAAFVVEVSTKNGPVSGVYVTLSAKPTSQKPTFTGGCAKGDKTSSCTVSSVSDKQAVSLQAQIPVASGASSVSSVTLSAAASVVTSATWSPPAADETVAVTAATPAPAMPSASASAETPLPLGPVPALNGVSSSLIGAGNAAGLFPAIVPSGTAAASPAATHAQGTRRDAATAADSSALGPVLTAQVAGLIALGLALILTVTRLSLTKRLRFKKRGS
jgi:hypothetical protein